MIGVFQAGEPGGFRYRRSSAPGLEFPKRVKEAIDTAYRYFTANCKKC